MIVTAIGVAGLVAALPLGAAAQTAPAPSASATPPATASTTNTSVANVSTESSSSQTVTGPAFGVNDPCTSVDAIVSRPSVSQSVCTVRPGHVLLETGYDNYSDRGVNYVTSPEAMVRVGTVVPALEVDLGLPGTTRIHTPYGLQTGSSDIGIGLKYVLGYTANFSYGASVLFDEPSGKTGFTFGDEGAGIQTYDFNWAYRLNRTFSLGGTMSVQSLAGTVGGIGAYGPVKRYSSVEPSVVLSASLPHGTSLFVEGTADTNGLGPQTALLREPLAGITKTLTPRSQIDFSLGSLNMAGFHDAIVGFGASYYF